MGVPAEKRQCAEDKDAASRFLQKIAINFNNTICSSTREAEGETKVNTFFRRSINEYQKQIGLKESFAIQTERLQEVLESADWTDFAELPADRRESRQHLKLLLLFPLIEIAWSDGRVTRRESDAILQVAEAYGLVKDDAGYCELLEKLISRPIPQAVGRMWQDFHYRFENLPESVRQNIVFCLDVQTRFIAEQSSNHLLEFLRGARTCQSEQEALRIVAEQLENAQSAAKLLEGKRNTVLEAEKETNETGEIAALVIADFSESESAATLEEYAKLVPVVPLVKTAWAEGRVTKRERHLVFEAANRFGIENGTPAHLRLAEWLEFRPTDEFYDSALDNLHRSWQKLSAEESYRRKSDLLDDCLQIAEA